MLRASTFASHVSSHCVNFPCRAHLHTSSCIPVFCPLFLFICRVSHHAFENGIEKERVEVYERFDWLKFLILLTLAQHTFVVCSVAGFELPPLPPPPRARLPRFSHSFPHLRLYVAEVRAVSPSPVLLLALLFCSTRRTFSLSFLPALLDRLPPHSTSFYKCHRV